MTLTANVRIKLTNSQNKKRATKNSSREKERTIVIDKTTREATNFGVEVMKYLSINNDITNFPSLFNTMSFRF